MDRRAARIVAIGGFALVAASGGVQADAPDPLTAPFLQLRDSYRSASPTDAAAAYAPDAVYREEYPGVPPVVRTGRAQIEQGFADLFTALGASPAGPPLDLNFRVTGDPQDRAGAVEGVWRLRSGTGETPDGVWFGRFEVEIANGLFVRDLNLPGTRDDFENSPGPVMFAADEEGLDSGYYNAFLGRWRAADGCEIRITRSVRRLFAEDSCEQTWRALSRVSGRVWTSGPQVLSTATTATYDFAPGELTISPGTSSQQRRFVQQAAPVREPVRFRSGDVDLAGTILSQPAAGARADRRPGVVLVHGSGPQDRHGYASIIERLAQELAEAGAVVLVYDKRGTGGSQGDWSRAGFAELASDAAAALATLRQRSDVDPARVGLAGSSQAGWVIARAIEDGAQPAFSILLGAAGAGLSVREQNLYNTQVRMGCAGVARPLIELALAQQAAFFDAVAGRPGGARLGSLSARAARHPELADWVFPSAAPTTRTGQWFEVLDPDYDPRPVWRNWSGKALFIFAEHDDSTPSVVAARRVRADARRGQVRSVILLDGAQHLGLTAGSLCGSDLEALTGSFHPELWPSLRTWFQQEVLGAR